MGEIVARSWRLTWLAAALAMFVPAQSHAAEPAAGGISPAGNRVAWTGSVTGYVDLVYVHAGGTYGTCVAPQCDTFTLEVTGSGGSLELEIAAAATTPAQELSIEVVHPDGQATFAGDYNGARSDRTVKIPAAPDGTYKVHVSGGSLPGGPTDMSYQASAALEAAGSGPCATLAAFGYEPGGAPLNGGPTDDPFYAAMHGHRQMGVPAAWARGGRGQGVTIAVIDTGIDSSHPDLGANLVEGVDMLDGKEDDCAPGPRDAHGHGTHVAGLSAAVAGNGIGVAGIAPRARIMPVRVCGANGSCPTEAVSQGIRWAVDHGAKVVNLSISGDETDLVTGLAPLANLSDNAPDVAYAVERGAIVVAAAGNSTWALCGHPAADPGAICVGAVDRDGLPASYSNMPADRDGEIDAFRAFGGDGSACDTLAVSTAWPGAGDNVCGKAYHGYAGTSMASPQVAGAAAVLLSFGIPAKDVVERLKATASNGGSYDPVMGYGIPDLDAATAGLKAPPEPAADPQPAPPGEASPHTAPAPRPVNPSRSASCKRAQAALRKAIRRAVRARRARSRRSTRATRVAYKRALRKRDATQRAVRRRCR